MAAHAVGVAAVAVAVAFLVLPVAAIFARVGPIEIARQLGTPVALDAIRVTVVTTLVAQALVLAVGTPCAYALARARFRGRSAIVTLLELPLVLPPAVAGIGLLAAFGSQGLLGDALEVAGIRIPFTQTAVVMAIVFVSSPFYLRTAIAAFESADPGLVDAAKTLGAGPFRVFGRVVLPLSLGGLRAGATLSLARGLGEFGATILFAGSLAGVTQTLSLAIYAEFDRDFDTSLAMGALLVVTSVVMLALAKIRTR